MSFASMKKNRMSFEELSTQLKDTSGGGGGKSYKDDRLWYPKLDENKNGYAVIRFLPTSEGDDLPFVKMFTHGYKSGTGKWYFENCPTTNNDDCPVCQANRKIVESHGGWTETPKSVKDGAIRNRKRKLSYYSNIYVVTDPETPENEGKVFLFKYGKKIFDQLMEATNPSFPDKSPIQPFDMWEGANYKLKIRQVEEQTNYDSSEFEAVSQFLESDEAMESVYTSQYVLHEIVAKDKFKDFNELQKNFARVEGGSEATATAETITESPVEKSLSDKPKFKSAETKSEPVADAVEPDLGDKDDDAALDYFKKLAED